MDLRTAITIVTTSAREEDPGTTQTDAEILAELRELGLDEINDWAETLDHFTPKMHEAHVMVIKASDRELAAAQA